MPKFTANSYLSHKGELVKPGVVIELTEEQAERLGDKVANSPEEVTAPVNDAQYTEAQFRELTADEQKGIVEGLEGDLNELTNEDKRWAYVSEKQ